MKNSIIWLARLGIDQSVFTRKAAWAVRLKLGEDVELIDYAQELIDGGHVGVDQVEALERLAGDALAREAGGAPEEDPFENGATNPPIPSAAAPAPEKKGLTLASRPAASSATAPSAADAPAPRPAMGPRVAGVEFPFERVAAMPMPELAEKLRSFLKTCARAGISDLHLSAGSEPFVRRQRVLSTLSEHVLGADDALKLNTALLAPHQRDLFLERKDLDYALALDAANRYRVNLLFHKGGAAGAYRMIASEIPKLETLGLRNLDAIRKLLSYHNGLILVTGPVGAGKTTTLAALVDELNRTREDHIITVEDPIEVVHFSKGCNVTQREVGPHTRSFATALKGALREDPDVIVIGELRDLETIEMAINASETGHLVIATMHTSDAATTLNRLLDVFPPAQQAQIRASVAESLRGVICQRLLPAMEGKLVPACEILISNAAVAALIREGKMSGLRNVLETGQREGMCLMENSVMQLHAEGKITSATARENITNRVLKARIA